MKMEDLKAGNPELSDGAAEYGVNRTPRLFHTHGGPAVMRLQPIQLAAILAGAYNDGHEDGRAAEVREREETEDDLLPAYYDCGICGHYHAATWDGDCRQDDARHTMEWLDMCHGPAGWREVPMPGSEEEL